MSFILWKGYQVRWSKTSAFALGYPEADGRLPTHVSHQSKIAAGGFGHERADFGLADFGQRPTVSGRSFDMGPS